MFDDLGDRMKKNYEAVSKTRLVRRMPVIIRIDGCHFHTYTRGFKKPFDHYLMHAMQETMQYLCENIQGCVFGYTQSDEISLLLIDYKKLESEAWFDNEVQKICSVSASLATAAFNKSIKNMALEVTGDAIFDSRCFNVPKEEVVNYFYWRQLDAMRNSVEMAGHANFSQKQLHKKSCNDIKEMLLAEKGIDFEKDFSLSEKRGTCCVTADHFRSLNVSEVDHDFICKGNWYIDKMIPVFKGDGRDYVEKLVGITV